MSNRLPSQFAGYVRRDIIASAENELRAAKDRERLTDTLRSNAQTNLRAKIEAFDAMAWKVVRGMRRFEQPSDRDKEMAQLALVLAEAEVRMAEKGAELIEKEGPSVTAAQAALEAAIVEAHQPVLSAATRSRIAAAGEADEALKLPRAERKAALAEAVQEFDDATAALTYIAARGVHISADHKLGLRTKADELALWNQSAQEAAE